MDIETIREFNRFHQTRAAAGVHRRFRHQRPVFEPPARGVRKGLGPRRDAALGMAEGPGRSRGAWPTLMERLERRIGDAIRAP